MGRVLEGQEPVAIAARRAVGEWLEKANRSAVSPSEAEIQRIQSLVGRCTGSLPEEWLREIGFAIR